MSQISNDSSGGGGGGDIQTITGNDGVPESPIAGNFNFLTSGSTVKFIGSASTETLNLGATNLGFGSTYPNLVGGSGNVSLGQFSNGNLTDGIQNVAIGIGALGQNQTGSDNIAIGISALSSMTTGGDNNIALGAGAGGGTEGDFNILIGASSNSEEGNYNIIIGSNGAGTQLTTADSDNILISSQGVSGDNNTIRIGSQGTGDSQQNTCFIAGIVGSSAGTNPAPVVIDTSGKLSSVNQSTGFGVPVIYSSQVNLLATGATQLATFSSGISSAFIITSITAVGTTITGVYGGGIADFGTNGPTYDNYVIAFSNFAPVQGQYVFTSAPGLVQVPTNTPFFINVTTADPTATANTQTIYIQGFYI